MGKAPGLDTKSGGQRAYYGALDPPILTELPMLQHSPPMMVMKRVSIEWGYEKDADDAHLIAPLYLCVRVEIFHV